MKKLLLTVLCATLVLSMLVMPASAQTEFSDSVMTGTATTSEFARFLGYLDPSEAPEQFQGQGKIPHFEINLSASEATQRQRGMSSEPITLFEYSFPTAVFVVDTQDEDSASVSERATIITTFARLNVGQVGNQLVPVTDVRSSHHLLFAFHDLSGTHILSDFDNLLETQPYSARSILGTSTLTASSTFNQRVWSGARLWVNTHGSHTGRQSGAILTTTTPFHHVVALTIR